MDSVLKWVIGIFVFVVLVFAAAAWFQATIGSVPEEVSAAQEGCLASGGTVGEAVCCSSVMGFPNTCVVGACACSAEFSHPVKTCNCPDGTCFNGTACAKVIGSFAECAAAGYPVMESYPRQCHVPGGLTFVEEIPAPITAESCTAARGHWNDCGSRCRLDNQGKTGIACPDLCEPLCECGGIAGFGCPGGYRCRMPSVIADALGYCAAEGSSS